MTPRAFAAVAVAGLVLFAPPAARAAYTVETLQSSGPSSNRIDLVILGDGYRVGDQTQLTTDAQKLLNSIFALTPYKEYRALFNVKLVHVVSNDNGADNGTYGALRDTTLGAYFNCSGVQRLLCVNNGTVLTIAAQNVPEYDVALVIVNDPMYGGAGGNVATTSINSSAPEIVKHELGHTFARLADEYTSAYPGYPACSTTTDCPEPNATLRTTRAQVKWNAWINPATPVPTPSGSGYTSIGVFQGCRYQTTGVYRPKDSGCLMNTLGSPFCSVCGEGLIESFWNRVSPIDSTTPSTPVAVTSCQDITLDATTPAVSTLTFQWQVDGMTSPVTTSTLTIPAGSLSMGAHVVKLVVTDSTALVKNDPTALLVETKTWNLNLSCSDGSVCTNNDRCVGATCVGDVAVTCPGGDQCHGAGVCDPMTGACSNPPLADGTGCDDGNLCTNLDHCTSGKCGGAPVVCSALDTCHAAGVCDPMTGACSNPVKPDGTSCSDGDSCTQTDECSGGACVGSNPVTCAALDQCHVAGTCNPATGMCSNPAQLDGTSCSDSDACTRSDSCVSGACVGANPVVCGALDQCHAAGVCNSMTGMCSNPAKLDGAACSDGNACTQSDVCMAGACVGANPVVCSALDQCHAAGICDPGTGTCSNPAQVDGTVCSDGNACTQLDACLAGTCTGMSPVVCAALDQCHVAGTCDPSTGACSNPVQPDGRACSDGNACTQTDSCMAGACVGGNAVVCGALDQCHVVGTCDPATGTCSNPASSDGTACDDGNACTRSDACKAGTCTGESPVVCTASDSCHAAGTCDPKTGACSKPVASDGTSCDGGMCVAGACTAPPPAAPPSGCGCALGGRERPSPLASVLLLLFGVATLIRRRRAP